MPASDEAGATGSPAPAGGARAAAWRALVALEKGRRQRLELGAAGLAPRDQALALELARGTERWRLLLDFALRACACDRLPRDPYVLVALRLGAYQLLKLDRMPRYAAVHDTVQLLPRRRALANAALRRLAGAVAERAADTGQPRRELPLGSHRALVLPPPHQLPDPAQSPAAYLGIRYALPEPLVARWIAAHGRDGAARAAAASACTPVVALCALRRRGTGSELRAALAADGVETEALAHPQLVRWVGGASPFQSRAFRDGWFVAQDPTAHAAAAAVGARPGEVVLDLCAAPGTKTAVLADAVAPDGHVHAYDVDERRRGRIGDNVARLGLGGLVTIHSDLARVPPADRALADVPCSNTGVLARRVEVRRRLERLDWGELARRQRQLLLAALAAVRPGGVVVYSTCSIEPEENQQVVAAAVARGHRLRAERLTLPACRANGDAEDHDGGYYAVLERAAPADAPAG